jgi:hypothetical protein
LAGGYGLKHGHINRESMRGTFRDSENWVRVSYLNGREIDMPKEHYEALKIEPPFDALPLADPPDPSSSRRRRRRSSSDA